MGALRDVCVADSRAGREWASGSPMRGGADHEDWLPWRALPACLLCPCVLTMLCCAVICRVWPSLASSSVQPVCSREGAGQVRSGWERQGRAGQVVYLDATAAIPLVDRLASGVFSCLMMMHLAAADCRHTRLIPEVNKLIVKYTHSSSYWHHIINYLSFSQSFSHLAFIRIDVILTARSSTVTL